MCSSDLSYSFEEIALSVCEIVHRICFPFITRTVVRSFYYTVDKRIADVHIRIGHIYLGTEHHFKSKSKTELPLQSSLPKA